MFPTSTALTTIVADTSQAFLAHYPLSEQFQLYIRAINLPDVIATLIIGVLVSHARLVYHYYYKMDEQITIGKWLLTPLIGMTGALMGSEIATMAGHEESSWLFVIAISWIGGSSLDRFAQAIIGLIDKALGAIGIRQEQKEKHIQKMDAIQQTADEKALQDALNEPL